MHFIIVALFIALLWGIQPLLQKNLLHDISTHTILVLSNLIFTVCLVIYAYLYRQIILDDFEKLKTEHWKLLIFSAVICSFLSTIIYYDLIKTHKPSIITALTYSAPIFTMLLGEYFLKETATVNAKFGIVLVVLGLSMMSYYN
jgi:uncharacterized membrane protein